MKGGTVYKAATWAAPEDVEPVQSHKLLMEAQQKRQRSVSMMPKAELTERRIMNSFIVIGNEACFAVLEADRLLWWPLWWRVSVLCSSKHLLMVTTDIMWYQFPWHGFLTRDLYFAQRFNLFTPRSLMLRRMRWEAVCKHSCLNVYTCTALTLPALPNILLYVFIKM